jgi:hypothetical protein
MTAHARMRFDIGDCHAAADALRLERIEAEAFS